MKNTPANYEVKPINIHNLEEATDEEVVAFIGQHLITQNEKCINDDGACVYRQGEMSCAAGCLIPKKDYKKKMEYITWGSLVDKGQVPDAHRDTINTLQYIHDFTPPRNWKSALNKLAKGRKLDIQFV